MLGNLVWDDTSADYDNKKFYIRGTKPVSFTMPSTGNLASYIHSSFFISRADYESRDDVTLMSELS